MDYFSDYESNDGMGGWGNPLDPMSPMDPVNPANPAKPAEPMGVEGAPEASEAEQTMSFEEAMARLERVVQRMESGSVSLDESLELFKEGSKLAAFCQKQLSDNENKIRQLLESEQGTQEDVFNVPKPDQGLS